MRALGDAAASVLHTALAADAEIAASAADAAAAAIAAASGDVTADAVGVVDAHDATSASTTLMFVPQPREMATVPTPPTKKELAAMKPKARAALKKATKAAKKRRIKGTAAERRFAKKASVSVSFLLNQSVHAYNEVSIYIAYCLFYVNTLQYTFTSFVSAEPKRARV
jgi:hypothetical protein